MPKLTDSQLVILSAAAQREDGAILPLSKSIKLNKGAGALVLKSLLRQGLATEKPASPEDEAWREEDGKRLTLAITASGLAAIGVDTSAKAGAPRTKATTDAKVKGRQAKGSRPTKIGAGKARTEKSPAGKAKAGAETKQGLLIDLLRRKGGATIEELTKATGWQPHSVRGAISGLVKKKLGLPVASEAIAGRGRTYRIAAR